MRTKGSIAKSEVSQKVLEMFPGSFLYNDGKEIRIPWTEAGEAIQLKLVLTAAKVMVESGMDNAVPGEVKPVVSSTPAVVEVKSVDVPKPTEDEMQTVKDLLRKLGI